MEEKINILSRVDIGIIVRKEIDLSLAGNEEELKKFILKEVFKKIKNGEIGKLNIQTKKYI